MLIRRAEVWRTGLCDVRIDGGKIAQMGALTPLVDEMVVEAAGAALLPGLHDHHLHLPALAVRQASLRCGPPEVADEAGLAAALQATPGTGWIRGIGYHESVMGLPDATALDVMVSDRPLRIQHRGGRMWLLNSRALEMLLARSEAPPGLERGGSRFTGRLFDADRWLSTTLGTAPPDFAAISRELAAYGITGLTDMGPANDAALAAHFAAQHEGGALLQHPVLAGTPELGTAPKHGWRCGPVKLHLHEAAMPGWDDAMALLLAARELGRGLAVHCTTEVELVYALALFGEQGVQPGDRIEHASLASDEQVARIAALGLPVVVEPHFIRERGDQYRIDIPQAQHHELYRLRTFAEAGIVLAGGSDAPFGSADPWLAMAAAIDRRTLAGEPIGPGEALTPEEALALYLADPLDLSRERQLAPGSAADLCLLDAPWQTVRSDLSCRHVRAVWIDGRREHFPTDLDHRDGADFGSMQGRMTQEYVDISRHPDAAVGQNRPAP